MIHIYILKAFIYVGVVCIVLGLCRGEEEEILFAKFDGDYVSFSSERYFRGPQLYQLVREAHAKYKFKSGIMYFDTSDFPGAKNLKPKTYYQSFRTSEADLFLKATGPDWTSIGWWNKDKDFNQAVYQIAVASEQKPKYNKAGWNGNIYSPLEFRPESKTRPMLLEFSANYSDYFHFHDVSKVTDTQVSMASLVEDYAVLLDIGGNGYSGRLKYLLYSNRPLLYVERDFVEYFSPQLKAYVHYIPVKMDLSDLVIQFQWIMNNPDKAAEIAQNAVDFAIEHLTHDAFIERVGEVVNYLMEDGH